jgi:uncharacterized repeat protein (TIGR01451 family)
MRFFCTLALCCTFAAVVSAQSKWANYVTDQNIYDVVPADDQLWVATQGGLVSVDRQTGSRQAFLPSNSPVRGHGMMDVAIDKNGVKWLGGLNGGLFRFENGNWEQFHYINTGDTLIEIFNIQIAQDGKVWFISNINNDCSGCRKLFSFDGTSFTRHDQNLGPLVSSGSYVSDFAIKDNGEIWIANYYHIFRYDGSHVSMVFDSTNTPLKHKERITGLELDANGNLWLTTDDYSMVFDPDYRVLKFDGSQWSINDEQSLGFPTGFCETFFKGGDGNLWFSFVSEDYTTKSYVRFDGNGWTNYTSADLNGSLPGYSPPQLFAVDQQGHWWMSMYKNAHDPKVFSFDGTAWTGYPTEIFPLSDNYFSCVGFDCDGNTWFGSGALDRFDGVNWDEFTSADIGFNLSVWAIESDTVTCDVWFASYGINEGLFRYHNGAFEKLPIFTGARDIAISPDGSIWIASDSRGAGHYQNGVWAWYNSSNSPVQDYAHEVEVDANGGLWVTSYGKGLAHWNGSNWQVFNESNSPVSNHAYQLFIDNNGFVWVGKRGGLLRFNGTDWQVFDLFGEKVWVTSMEQDANQHFWIGTSAGAFYWDGVNLVKYDISNSPIGQNAIGKLKIDPYGNKWFVHSTGVSVFNENGISNQVLTPKASAKGSVFFDNNQDGLQAANEPGIPGNRVLLLPENTTTFTNIFGEYAVYPPAGNHELALISQPSFVPTSATQLDLFMGNQDQTGFDFGIWTSNPPKNIGVDLTVGPARCNRQTVAWVHLSNLGVFDTEGGEIQLTFDPALELLDATIAPDLVENGLLTWYYDGLGAYEYFPIKVIFESPGVDAVGVILPFTLTATRMTGNEVAQTVTDYAETAVICSFDPNDKQCEATGVSDGNYSLLDDPLMYTIRFQNKGNDTAFVVVIRDTLDAGLDISSFSVVSSSHPVRATLQANGVLTFHFANINLPWESFDEPASHGYVKFRIAPKPGLPDPTTIHNTAHIYFDFNPAIVTNTTENVLVKKLFLDAGEAPSATTLAIRPNPASGKVRFDAPEGASIIVYDSFGRQLFAKSLINKELDLGGLVPGIYWCQVKIGGKVLQSGKVIRQ